MGNKFFVGEVEDSPRILMVVAIRQVSSGDLRAAADFHKCPPQVRFFNHCFFMSKRRKVYLLLPPTV
jgi:hypothetical protein